MYLFQRQAPESFRLPQGTESAEEAWVCLNKRWQDDRLHHISAIREVEEQNTQRSQNRPGDKLVLQQDDKGKCYTGRVWRDLEQWSFQEEGTGIQVVVAVDSMLSIRQNYQQCEGKLFRAMRAEHVKRKQAAAKARRKDATKADGPKTTADMTVKGKSPEGKLLYVWADSDRGRVEVPVTPRAMRMQGPEGMSTFREMAARETTPERALRKIKAKVQKIHAKAVRGEQERIVAKAPQETGALPKNSEQREHMPEATHAPCLRTLNDPEALQIVIASFEFLASLRLHYCSNCDEQWPVYDAEWPQTGVAWAGPQAGRCETIERAGFRVSDKDPERCSRCDSHSAYKKMYCEENLQHLGPRHPALSALTWYESLLIARVHPVISVITLTATGLLCYAGHVCNYYVKVMEWIQGLPAVLRDKKWFLIKRRRSIRAGTADSRQKKPTTANRRRLEAAIREALQYMPRVYTGSEISAAELNKYPHDGEQEMLEQAECVDLNGEVHVPQEVFAVWFVSGTTSPAQRPCAAIIHRYAMDQQGLDFRGSVSSDTAWELCYRLLSLRPEQDKMGTRHLAALLVYWLEQGQVPAQMGEAVYNGMVAELQSRGKCVETHEDEEHMKCRWIRQAIHAELDSVREEWAASGKELPVDFEVGESSAAPGFVPTALVAAPGFVPTALVQKSCFYNNL